MKIVIVATDHDFDVRVIDDQGLTTPKFIYNDLRARAARRAAAAWRAAYGDCEIVDQTEKYKR